MVGQYLRGNSGIRNVGRHHMPEAGDGKTLEQRVRVIEDRLEIYNLIASHPPSADTGAGDYTASVWTDDSVFDRGAEFARPTWRAAIAAGSSSLEHHRAIEQGIAHFAGFGRSVRLRSAAPA